MDFTGEQYQGMINGVKAVKEQKDTKKETKDTLKSIYKNYPALKAMGKVILKADTSYTKDKTGAGSIEYFSPKERSITYNTGYKYKHPQRGTHGIVYNPNTTTEQGIALDMLHGMTQDKTYDKYREEFMDVMGKSKFNNDLQNEWQQFKDERGKDIPFWKQEKFEKFKSNWIDGIIRNLMFEGTPEDFKKANYWEDAREVYLSDEGIKDKFGKIEKYLKTGKK